MMTTLEKDKPTFRLKTLAMDYKPGDIPVEYTVYCDYSNWGTLEFNDLSTMAYCAFVPPYLGPKNLFESIRPVLVAGAEVYSCRFLAHRELYFQEAVVDHKHDRKSFCDVQGDFVIEQVVRECGGWYFVGNRLKFYNLLHRKNGQFGCVPIPAEVWTGKHVQIMKDGSIEAPIYLVQDFQTGILNVLKYMADWRCLEFGRLCNVFFGADENIDLDLIRQFRQEKEDGDS